jgi:hypothetical protein
MQLRTSPYGPKNDNTRLGSLLLAAQIASVLCLAQFMSSACGQTAAQSRQLQHLPQVSVWPSKAKRWALVIGVDKYRDENISDLRGAANDAHTLAQALIQYAGFPSDQVILLATDQSEGRQPTRINIFTYLSNLASTIPTDGLLLVSFSGHGLERGGQAYLIPSDARLNDDVSLLEESAVSVARIRERIRATGAAQVVVLLDACRNDPGGRADAPNLLTMAYTRGFNFDVNNSDITAFVTLYATAVGQRAYEYADKKQGYFTWAVVEALKGAAANEKGEVTLAQLVKYVQETVPKRVLIDLGAGKVQRPFYQMEGYKAEELVIASTGTTSLVESNAKLASVDPLAVELKYWDSIKNSIDPNDFKAYIDKFPDGQFVALAKNKVSSLALATKLPESSAAFNEARLGSWIDYTSSEGRYTVSLPAQPKLGTQESATADGQKFLQYMATVQQSDVIYLVGYFDHVAGTTFSADRARDGMVKAVKGNLLSERNISLNGYQGRELRVGREAEGTEYIILARFLDTESRVYVLQVVYPKSGENEVINTKSAKYFDSFQILKN